MLLTPGNECSCCACTLAALFRDDGQSQQTTHDINIEFFCFPSKFVSTEIRRIFFNFHQLWGWSRCTTRMKSVWCIRAATIFFFRFEIWNLLCSTEFIYGSRHVWLWGDQHRTACRMRLPRWTTIQCNTVATSERTPNGTLFRWN